LNVAESLQIWLSGAGVSEKTERAGSGPEGNSAGIDPIAVAQAMAGASCARMDALLEDQQEQPNSIVILVQIAPGGSAPELQGRVVCLTS
jgi:hypothetical protein